VTRSPFTDQVHAAERNDLVVLNDTTSGFRDEEAALETF
jgi:hypothetical protein